MNRSTGKEVYLHPAKYNFIKQKNREHNRQNAARRVGQRKRNNGASNFTDLATQTNKKDSIRRRSHHKGSREKRVRAIVRKMWAVSTIDQRKRLWSRYVRWVTDRSLPMDANSAVLFVTATGAKSQSLLNYAKALSGIMKHLGMENQPLRSLQVALRADGATVPESQATPIPREILEEWCQTQELGVSTAVMVAWKTMSRWGEVAALSSGSFIQRPFNSNCGLEPDSEGKEGESVHGFKVRGNHRKMDGGDTEPS